MPDLPRRNFLHASTVLAAAAAAGARWAPAVAPAPPGPPGLVRSTFAALVGRTFQVVHPGGRTAVVLAAVEDLGAGGDPEHCFSLSFDGPPGPALAQGVYPVVRGDRLRHEVLVVPVDRAAVRARYQVVVNRPTAVR